MRGARERGVRCGEVVIRNSRSVEQAAVGGRHCADVRAELPSPHEENTSAAVRQPLSVRVEQ
ncbi:hypothetical protein GCM10014715_46350 [Streptomyces spiralis]|uniref:Uncharacterized protein n=1 Tax=Streptomyces spiralis TaxID=66376 RepID=A0A919A3L2_9ACTN|nr:hypothetical protein GCM10014715_46350 [Streptomyces spiralis]